MRPGGPSTGLDALSVRTGRGLLEFVWTHPANRAQRLRAVARTLAWQLYKRVGGRHRDLRYAGLLIRCYPDSTSASLVLYCSGQPDFHEMAFMRHYLRRGDNFIDVGANVGVYTLLAASLVGPEGSVEAFEPGPKALCRLRENVALNSLENVHVYPVAVGTSRGPVRFTLDRDATNRIGAGGVGERSIEVSCVRLDDMLIGRRYAMGKMDIEGAEPLALRGCEGMLAQSNPPVWQLELGGYSRAYGFPTDQVVGWLKAKGYDTALYDADRRSLVFTERPWESRAANALAVARSARGHLANRISALATVSPTRSS